MASAFPARGLASPRSAKISAIKAATLAFILVLIVCQIALAGRGTVSISAITDNGNGSYTLTVNSTSGMTVGDHFGARTGSSTGPGGVWEVMSIPSGISVIVSDTLTEENGTAFGLPQTGSAWFGTPTTSTDLSRPPHNAVAYDAALRRNYYLVDGKQPLDADLTTLGGLAKTDGNFIVADGSNWTVESGATARASLGLTIGTNVQAYDAQLADVAGLTPTDNAVVIGNGTNFVAESGATLKTSLGLTIGTDVQAYDADLTTIAAISGVKGDVLVHNGTDWIRLPVGTNGQVLEANSAVAAGVEWGTDDSSGGSSHDLLSATHTDTTAAAVARGSVIVGDSTPKWVRRTVGAAGTVLGSDGTDTTFRTFSETLNSALTEAQGDILYRGASDWTNLGPGTSGQFLKTNGSGANPAWASGLPIQAFTAITAGTGSPTDLTGTANGTTITNSGTTVKAACTLPSAAAGMSFFFINVDTDGFRINAAAGDVINLGDVVVTATAGYVESVRVSSSFYLVAVDTTNWYGFEITGTWRKDSTTSAGWAFTRTAWASATFTMTWASGATISGRVAQDGNMLYGFVEILVTGAVTAATLTVDLPSGYTMDFTSMGWNASTYHCLGVGMSTDISAVHRGSFGLASQASDTNTMEVVTLAATSISQVNNTVPNTWANGDNLILNFAVAVQ